MNTLEQATNKIDLNLLNQLEHGQEIELNETFSLYKYTEEEVYTVVKTETWEEVMQVLINENNNEIIFEVLDYDIMSEYE